MIPTAMDRDEARFWRFVNFNGPIRKPELGPCWEWTGRALTHNGYGRFRAGGRRTVAHRWIWERQHGPVPDGMELDHLCRNRLCVRHLEAVTRAENHKRSNHPGKRAHCPKGHPYDEQNTRLYQGRRYCRACMAEVGRTRDREQMRKYQRAYKRRQRAKLDRARQAAGL